MHSAGAWPSDLLHVYSRLLTGCAIANVDRAVVQALLAGRDPTRDAEEVGVGELLPRPCVTVVEQHVAASRLERRGRTLGDLLRAHERHDVVVKGRDRLGPDDAALVVVLLDDGRHRAGGPDPVAAHDDRLLTAGLVEIGCLQRHRVPGAEVEEVADLDRRLDVDAAAAVRARIALLDMPQIGPGVGPPVPTRLDAEEVPPVAVRAGHVLALAQELVGDDLAVEAHGPERAPVRPERLPDLLG